MSIEREINTDYYINKDTETVVQIKGEGHDKRAVIYDPGETTLLKGQEISHREIKKRNGWEPYQ